MPLQHYGVVDEPVVVARCCAIVATEHAGVTEPEHYEEVVRLLSTLREFVGFVRVAVRMFAAFEKR